MNVLVACHCKHTHDPVYLSGDIIAKNPKYYNLYDTDELAEAKRIFGIENIDYIEKRECMLDKHQHREWNKLPRKYDMIVSVHCPVYGLFHDHSNYKYIDFNRDFYKDVRDNLKPNGFFHLPYNIYPKYLINKIKIGGSSRKTHGMDIEYFNRHNSNENVKKVMHDILGDVGNYNLEIVDYKHRSRIPFFIDTYKKGTWSNNSKSTFRHLIITFPKGNRTSKKTNKQMSMIKNHASKTKKKYNR
jgi:hypothetical protein